MSIRFACTKITRTYYISGSAVPIHSIPGGEIRHTSKGSNQGETLRKELEGRMASTSGRVGRYFAIWPYTEEISRNASSVSHSGLTLRCESSYPLPWVGSGEVIHSPRVLQVSNRLPSLCVYSTNIKKRNRAHPDLSWGRNRGNRGCLPSFTRAF